MWDTKYVYWTFKSFSVSKVGSVMTLDIIASPADVAAVLQELWCGMKRVDGTFLHSPLLEELKSLEVMLVRQAYRKRKGKDSADSSVDSRKAAQDALQSVHSVSVDLPVQVSNKRHRMKLTCLAASSHCMQSSDCLQSTRHASTAAQAAVKLLRTPCGLPGAAGPGEASQERMKASHFCPARWGLNKGGFHSTSRLSTHKIVRAFP